MGIKRGIIQSRGLGDIIIALPIAKFYHEQGDTIYWPVCEEFISHFAKSVPWVNWLSVPTDANGDFFLVTPLRLLRDVGCVEDEILNLYQYLSSSPELTDPELFNILKFDQYKYWVAGVPFMNKWSLDECIKRDTMRENALHDKLKLGVKDRYAVTQMSGSNFKADVNTAWLDPAVRVIAIEDHLTDCIFDWLFVLEGCEAFVGVDSCFVNLVDSLALPIEDKYFIRRSSWDLTPVLGDAWIIIPTNLPIVEPTRVDVVAAANAKVAAQNHNQSHGNGSVKSHVPFQAAGAIPDNFMDALTIPVQDPAVPSVTHGALNI